MAGYVGQDPEVTGQRSPCNLTWLTTRLKAFTRNVVRIGASNLGHFLGLTEHTDEFISHAINSSWEVAYEAFLSAIFRTENVSGVYQTQSDQEQPLSLL